MTPRQRKQQKAIEREQRLAVRDVVERLTGKHLSMDIYSAEVKVLGKPNGWVFKGDWGDKHVADAGKSEREGDSGNRD